MAEDFNGPTIPANRSPNPAVDYVVQDFSHRLEIAEVEARVRRAFWHGVYVGAVWVGVICSITGWLS